MITSFRRASLVICKSIKYHMAECSGNLEEGSKELSLGVVSIEQPQTCEMTIIDGQGTHYLSEGEEHALRREVLDRLNISHASHHLLLASLAQATSKLKLMTINF